MGGPRRGTQMASGEKQNEMTPDRRRQEALARFEERVSRNGNMSGFKKRLDIDLDLFKKLHPGFVPRWVKDDGARVTQMYGIGWDFVPYDPRIAVGDPVTGGGNSDIGNRISVIGGKDSNKAEGAYRLVLMMIPEEIHTQIVAAKQERNDEKDGEINRLLRGEGSAPVGGNYTPDSGAGSYVP